MNLEDDHVTFAAARLGEEERYARTVTAVGLRQAAKATPEDHADAMSLAITVLSDPEIVCELEHWVDGTRGTPPNDLGRVLRDVESGRRILERHRDCVPWGGGPCEHAGTTGEPPCPDLRDLLRRWGDHPRYNQAWAPETGG